MKSEFILEFERPLRDLQNKLEDLKRTSEENKVDVKSEIDSIVAKLEITKKDIYTNLSPWQRVQIARHPKRPYALDYIAQIFTDFQELHGDRLYGDDQSIIGGTAFLKDQPVMIIAQQKGRNTKENLLRNFGCPHPEGYRKALRLMKMAERFQLPVISLIDTPGAFPGIGAEERHVAEAIAVNIREMSLLKIPVICMVIGEGGSGGALGIGIGDRVLILENAYYSVISPEGCAAILWKDRAYAPDAAKALRLGAPDLLKLKIVDEVLEEPLGGAHNDPDLMAKHIDQALQKNLREISSMDTEKRLQIRYEKFRRMGVYEENGALSGPTI
ncbi:MAG: acetyl-CoA carboxylase carboxyltransferase subunit alpha [Opitutales bacterium]|nr:acetyl-CoA carboxylase carboxyltransferase subunit alpha [Opitutales bacterium]MCH8539246.1 acetyl-CoA carboxylase carboxyltransferase subunit alpha [Opitutales bacterium]